MLLIDLLLACHRAPTEGDSDEAPAVEDATLHFGNENNYIFEGILNAPRLPLAALQDGAVEWGSLDADLQCHALDPVAEIDNVSLMVFPYLSADEVEEGLAVDSLQQVDMGIYLSHQPGDATEIVLSDLTFCGTEANIHEEFTAENGTWLVLFSTGTGVGVGSRMMAFLEPTEGGPTTATVRDGCSVLDHTVEFETLEPIEVSLDGPWVVDWSDLTVTGQGGPLIPTRVDSLKLARFETLTLADLEEQFLDLDTVATQQWSAPHPSSTVDDLSVMVDVIDGSPFPGFHDDGVWILALMCDSCPVPAPLALTVLTPLTAR